MDLSFSLTDGIYYPLTYWFEDFVRNDLCPHLLSVLWLESSPLRYLLNIIYIYYYGVWVVGVRTEFFQQEEGAFKVSFLVGKVLLLVCVLF